MKCKWYADFEGVCTNGECPYRGDVCPAQNLSTVDYSKALKELAADMLEKLAAEKDGREESFDAGEKS